MQKIPLLFEFLEDKCCKLWPIISNEYTWYAVSTEDLFETIYYTSGGGIIEFNNFCVVRIIINDGYEFLSIQFKKISCNFIPRLLYHIMLNHRLFRLFVWKHLTRRTMLNHLLNIIIHSIPVEMVSSSA